MTEMFFAEFINYCHRSLDSRASSIENQASSIKSSSIDHHHQASSITHPASWIKNINNQKRTIENEGSSMGMHVRVPCVGVVQCVHTIHSINKGNPWCGAHYPRCSFGSTWHSTWHWVGRCCSKMLFIMEIISTNLVRAKYSKPTAYIHTSENAEEITIDQWKGNKKPDACFPMCCAHARCVSRMFFSPERIRDCTTHCIKRCCQSQPWPVLSIADEFQ